MFEAHDVPVSLLFPLPCSARTALSKAPREAPLLQVSARKVDTPLHRLEENNLPKAARGARGRGAARSPPQGGLRLHQQEDGSEGANDGGPDPAPAAGTVPSSPRLAHAEHGGAAATVGVPRERGGRMAAREARRRLGRIENEFLFAEICSLAAGTCLPGSPDMPTGLPLRFPIT